jgi:secretion/DNA translocation related TadE-like protein
MTVPSPRGDRDRGAATLLAAVLVSALALAAAAGAAVGSVALRRSQVQAVADVAALAAAQSVSDPCTEAAGAAAANRMILVTCSVVDGDIRVEVAGEASPALARVLGLLGQPEPTVIAAARAGPPTG